MQKTAIILGATGLTGGFLLEKLLKDKLFQKVKVFGRSSTGISHPKLEEHIISLLKLKNHANNFTADVVFCCIGTTKSKTPDKKKYKQIDYGIPVAAAKLCKQNDIPMFVVMSSMGSDVESSLFYNKVKGEMERDVLAQNIQNTFILQPSIIGGKRNEKRTGERLLKFFTKLIDPMLPKKYQTIHPETIAEAMQRIAIHSYDETLITSDAIKEIAEEQ